MSGGTRVRRPSAPASTVSARSARRFAARNRSRRWLAARPALALVALAVVLGSGLWLFYASTLLDLRTVEVVGQRRVPAAQIKALAAGELGRPLARVDTGAVEASVAAVADVRAVEVTRRWPHGVRISVTERAPAAVVRSAGPGGRYRFVDGGGVVFGSLHRRPAGLPVVEADAGSVDPATLRAALDVLAALPRRIERRVRTARAGSPDDIALELAGGDTVRWGSARESRRKATVLAALMHHRARVYDVSAPDIPTTRK